MAADSPNTVAPPASMGDWLTSSLQAFGNVYKDVALAKIQAKYTSSPVNSPSTPVNVTLSVPSSDAGSGFGGKTWLYVGLAAGALVLVAVLMRK